MVHYTEDGREDGGWYYYKSLWAVAPSYRGPVSITGRQEDEPDRFASLRRPVSGQKLSELHFPAEPGEGWRFGPRIRCSGLPAATLDVWGNGFRYAITFRAEPQEPAIPPAFLRRSSSSRAAD